MTNPPIKIKKPKYKCNCHATNCPYSELSGNCWKEGYCAYKNIKRKKIKK